ncbi:MAG: N-acetylglutaminylglutamine amidotransferase [Desulfuromonadales bacterium]|jgi:asparagine synthase (glutamine-hydrolysing)
MCGLCGEIRFDGRPASAEVLDAMACQMVPRGPDASGLFLQDAIGFGHRRLKIIDLSKRAQQPMIDAQLGLTIVYNGAIYNYPELRRDLEKRGYTFFSDGDTEVILKAYHAWGRQCVDRFNGMFAFALWERDSGRLLLARDRLGIKPLYLADVSGGLRFASSLPALVKSGGVDTDIDPVALHHYLSFHAVVPAPHTILKGVRKLNPGTTLMIEPDGKRDLQSYWQPCFERQPGDQDRSFPEWQEQVLDALRLAVKRRLIADVPVGALLSGGLDSSLIVGLLAEAGQHDLKTYSVGFESVDEEAGDEFQYSDIIAREYATDHHKIFIDSERLLPALDLAVAAMSEPMVSHDAVGFFLLAEEVAKDVKVVQSGQGADEVFAGYHWYPPMLDTTDPVAEYRQAFFDRDHEEVLITMDPDLHGDDVSTRFVAEHFGRPGATEPIDQALRLDTMIMLVDDPVKRVDNMTMAWSLEARVPFLDHELVELAARIPGRYKVAGGGKHVLKEAARKIIPAEVIDRPKGYFPVPALKYLRGAYLERVRQILDKPAARHRGLYQPDYVTHLLEEPEAHITPLRGSKLWQLTLLEYWLQAHGI